MSLLQSLFICSRTWMRSCGCRAKSPASVGEYAYKAVATDSACGTWGTCGYAGGGGLAECADCRLAFSFKEAFANWLVGGEYGVGGDWLTAEPDSCGCCKGAWSSI